MLLYGDIIGSDGQLIQAACQQALGHTLRFWLWQKYLEPAAPNHCSRHIKDSPAHSATFSRLANRRPPPSQSLRRGTQPTIMDTRNPWKPARLLLLAAALALCAAADDLPKDTQAPAATTAASSGGISFLAKALADKGGFSGDEGMRKLLKANAADAAQATCRCGSRTYRYSGNCYCWCGGKKRRSLLEDAAAADVDATGSEHVDEAMHEVYGGRQLQGSDAADAADAATGTDAATSCNCNGARYSGRGCSCWTSCRG